MFQDQQFLSPISSNTFRESSKEMITNETLGKIAILAITIEKIILFILTLHFIIYLTSNSLLFYHFTRLYKYYFFIFILFFLLPLKPLRSLSISKKKKVSLTFYLNNVFLCLLYFTLTRC